MENQNNSIKENIQCEVEKLMSKFCSKQELKDIQQENEHPNSIRNSVAQKQTQEIEAFAEKLIQNINDKISLRENQFSHGNSMNRNTQVFHLQNSNKNSSIISSNKHVMRGNHTFDNQNLSKFALKESIQNLSPISKGSNQNLEVKEKWLGVIFICIITF